MAEAYLIDKLKSVEETFHELTRQMADPDVASQPGEFQRVAKARAALEEVVATYEQWKNAQEELKGAKQVLKEAANEPELKEMAQLEVEELEEKLPHLEERLQILLLPKDPNDDKNIMLEIRAGAGGDEASIWAGDLLNIYNRYAASQGWKMSMVSESRGDMGGYSEIILEVTGEQVFSKLKYEAGVHRVQRVPATESGGRVHTSTATVAVMPPMMRSKSPL